MKKFEVGKTYIELFIGDHNLYTEWKVIKRTACTITVTDGDHTKTCRINKEITEMNDAESAKVYNSGSLVASRKLKSFDELECRWANIITTHEINHFMRVDGATKPDIYNGKRVIGFLQY